MKIRLIIETPEDDDTHYPRIGKALVEYTQHVAINNEFGHLHHDIDTKLGRDFTAGPNTFVASNGVVVTEERIK